MKKKIRAAALVLTALLMLSACSSDLTEANAPQAQDVVRDEMGMAYTATNAAMGEYEAQKDMGGGAAEPPAGSEQTAYAAAAERKLIKNMNFSIETLEFEASVEALARLIDEHGGYVQSSSVTGTGALEASRYHTRSASYTVRVPADRADALAAALSEVGSIVSSGEQVEEVTEYYYDVEARLRSLTLQEERLLALLEKSDTLSDVIALERELSDVRYQIESHQGTLRKLDSLIAYSTVTVWLEEVLEITQLSPAPKTLGERIAQRFGESVKAFGRGAENVLVFLIGDFVSIAFWGVVLAGGVYIVRRLLSGRALRLRAGKKRQGLPREGDQPPTE